VWLYSAHNPDLKAGVAWYGRVSGEPTQMRPRNPVDVVKEMNAPVLGLYAGRDTGIRPDQVELMRAALAGAGRTASEIVVYPEAGHGFNADDRPSYHPESAADGWARMMAWFRANGAD